MKVVWIALKDLRLAARDRKGLLLLLAMPLILIAILGSAFSGSFDTAPKISPFSVGLVDNDGGEEAKVFKDFLAAGEINKIVIPVVMSEAEARSQVADGELSAAILIPQGFSEKVQAATPASLEILKDQTDTFKPAIVESICQSYVMRLVALQQAVGIILMEQSQPKPGAEVSRNAPNPDLSAIAQQVNLELQKSISQAKEELSASQKPPSAVQYYSAAMGVMFLLFTGITGLQSMASERQQQTFTRTYASPTSPYVFLLGKFLGVVCIAFCQFIILALGTALLFKVRWGPPLTVISIALAYSWAVSGMALALSAWITDVKASTGGWSIMVQVFSALGGSMIPLTVFPPAMLAIAHFTPNYWGLQALLAAMQTGPFPWNSVLALFALGSVTLIAGSLKTRV